MLLLAALSIYVIVSPPLLLICMHKYFLCYGNKGDNVWLLCFALKNEESEFLHGYYEIFEMRDIFLRDLKFLL